MLGRFRQWYANRGITPRQRLERLEAQALELGMTEGYLAGLRSIGSCPAQTIERIDRLTTWIADNQPGSPSQVPEVQPAAEHEPDRDLVGV